MIFIYFTSEYPISILIVAGYKLAQPRGRREEGVFGAPIGYVSEDDLAGAQRALFTEHGATLKAKAALFNGGAYLALGDRDQSSQIAEESFAVPGAADSMTHWLVGGARHGPLL